MGPCAKCNKMRCPRGKECPVRKAEEYKNRSKFYKRKVRGLK